LAASYTDSSGNAGASATSANFTIDTLAPAVSSFTISDTTLKLGETSTVTIVFSETISGFASADDVTVTNGILTEMTSSDTIIWIGIYTPSVGVEDAINVLTLAVSYTDTAGNTGAFATSANFTIDTLAPVIIVTSGTDSIELGSSWADAGAIAVEGETVITSGSVDINTVGNYTITYSATDASGNIGTATRTVTIVDVTAPVITSGYVGTNLAENSGAGQTIYTITATDAEGVTSYSIAGQDAVLLSVNSSNGNVSLTANPDYETKNSYSFTATANDASGNASAPATVTFSVTDVAIELGASYQGGTIFYLNGSGGGLIVADASISVANWSNGTSGYGTSASFGTGQLNTTRIINGNPGGGTYAARDADNYSIEADGVTYNDWYLPSNGEATVMFNSGVVTTFLPNQNWMWTSTGYPPYSAYEMSYLGYIGHSNRFQSGYMYIKPVRNF
jgi:hypothetical protein